MEWKYPLLRNWYRGPLDPAAVARARRVAASMGWRVEKSRERYQHHNNQGALQILDRRNTVINLSSPEIRTGRAFPQTRHS